MPGCKRDMEQHEHGCPMQEVRREGISEAATHPTTNSGLGESTWALPTGGVRGWAATAASLQARRVLTMLYHTLELPTQRPTINVNVSEDPVEDTLSVWSCGFGSDQQADSGASNSCSVQM